MAFRHSSNNRTQGTYIVLTGLPCTGKTTLGRWLSQKLGLPFLYHDEIMDILFKEIKVTGLAMRRKIHYTTDRVLSRLIEVILKQGGTFVLEEGFHARKSTFFLSALKQLNRRYRVIPFQIHCSASPAVLLQRAQRRTRPAWADAKHSIASLRGKLEFPQRPAPLGGLLMTFDTTHGWQKKRSLLLRTIKTALRNPQAVKRLTV